MFEINTKIYVPATALPVLTGDQEITFDPFTGEPIFGVNDPSTDNTTEPETVIHTIEASLDWSNSDINPIDGKDIQGLYLEGRTFSAIPTEYKSGVAYNMDYLVDGNWVSQKFYSVTTFPGRLGLESVFGKLIAGYLIDA